MPRTLNKVRLLELLPHREPMLLLDELVHVDASSGSALVHVTKNSTFCIPDRGVPSWVGLEYMGQTAALIGGFQQRSGVLNDHTGFLLGSRQFSTTLSSFTVGTSLRIHCEQSALVGATLATFTARIHLNESIKLPPIATAVLSVFRQPPAQDKNPGLTK